MPYKDPETKRGHYRVYSRIYRATHKAEIAAQTHAYRATHKAEKAARDRTHYAAHPAQQKARVVAHRAHKKGAPINDLTHAQWLEIQSAQDHRCHYCAKRCKGRLTQDHITPLSKGGSHTLHNVIGACRSCNSQKHTGPPLRPVQPLLLTLAASRRIKTRSKVPARARAL